VFGNITEQNNLPVSNFEIKLRQFQGKSISGIFALGFKTKKVEKVKKKTA